MNTLMRFIKNIFFSPLVVYRYFPKSQKKVLKEAIELSESKHHAELRIVVEQRLSVLEVLRGVTSRQKAIDLFSLYRIWDTEKNNGVLIYLLLSENKIEIIADRGITKSLAKDYWSVILENVIITYFKKKEYVKGLLESVEKITVDMENLYPQVYEDENELSDEVIFI